MLFKKFKIVFSMMALLVLISNSNCNQKIKKSSSYSVLGFDAPPGGGDRIR